MYLMGRLMRLAAAQPRRNQLVNALHYIEVRHGEVGRSHAELAGLAKRNELLVRLFERRKLLKDCLSVCNGLCPHGNNIKQVRTVVKINQQLLKFHHRSPQNCPA